MKPCSLRTLIAVRFALVVLAVILAVSVASNLLISRQFEAYVAQQQSKEAGELAMNLSYQYDNASGEWNVDYIHGMGMYALSEGYIICLYDAQGNVVWDAENHDMTLCAQMMDTILVQMKQARPQVQGEFITQRFDLTLYGQAVGCLDVRYYSPYYLSDSDFRFMEALNRILVGVGIVSLAGAAAMGWVLANSIARPIAKTVEITERISGGDTGIRFRESVAAKELLDLARAVNRMAQSLEEQEGLRERLTCDVAHELRTPLANVCSYLEAILEGVWEPTAQRLESCSDELQRISCLVSDLERLQQAQSETLNKTEEDLLALAKAALARFEKQLEEKGLRYTVEGAPAPVLVDRDRMLQVLTNLISNAIKYTPEHGRLRIAVEARAHETALSVEDDGIGIAPEDQKHIFERFYRADQSRNRRSGGAGIGLAIVRAIVQAHGGEVSVRSEPGHGSVFTVTLPGDGERA